MPARPRIQRARHLHFSDPQWNLQDDRATPKLLHADEDAYSFRIPDGGPITIYLPNILPEAIKAKLVAPLPKDPTPNTYAIGKGGARVVIEPLDRDSLNPQPYYKDMTGWNRKAVGLILPADAGEALPIAEQFLALAATWPAAIEPSK